MFFTMSESDVSAPASIADREITAPSADHSVPDAASARSKNESIVRLQGDLAGLVQVLVEGLNRQLASYEIDAVEYTVLSACLSAGPISINDLRKLLPIDPGHMTRTTNRLEDKELIEKARSSADRRLVVVTMTDAGAALTPELTTRVHEFYGLLVRGISLEELVGCMAVMERMIGSGERPEPTDQAIESYVGALQTDVMTLMNVMFGGIQERVSPFGLAVGEYSIFTACHTNGSIAVSDLAQYVPFDATRISRIVSKLEDRGLVRKVRPDRDRRVVIVEMTEKGNALALELMASVSEHYAAIASRVRERELTSLLRFIERMTANAESAVGAAGS